MTDRQKVATLITDVDNTLFDWVNVWHASFSAMLRVIVEKSGIPQEVLETEIREIHQRHGTSEYSFLIEEIPSLQKKHPGEDLKSVYEDAIHAYSEARRASLRLYPGVLDTVRRLKSSGVVLVAYTESMLFYTKYRMKRLDLDLYFDFLYHCPDHALPAGMTPDQIRRYESEHYLMRHTTPRETPKGELKPNPDILQTIVNETGGSPDQAIYVGDSLMKDVAMAQSAGIRDVWARYGVAQQREEYGLLRRVTHWTDADVEREKALTRRDIVPTYRLNTSFGEVLELFDFGTERNTSDKVTCV